MCFFNLIEPECVQHDYITLLYCDDVIDCVHYKELGLGAATQSLGMGFLHCFSGTMMNVLVRLVASASHF